LTKTLFGWHNCSACMGAGTCPCGTCAWSRLRQLDAYFSFYTAITSWSIPEDLIQGWPPLRDHTDLRTIIRLIQNSPDAPRSELIRTHFSSYGQAQPDQVDKCRAFDLAIRVLTMAECSPRGCYSINWNPGFAPIPWLAEESARQFIAKAVPRHSSFDVEREYNSVRFAKLTATSLERHSNIKLAWTHDLRKHLLLDKEKNPRTLYIYHHIGFLREYLAATRHAESNIP
jgi:hypothetical protein